jgi:chromosome segregation ATPase
MSEVLKTKKEELAQLTRFLSKLEPRGYLEQIFKGVYEYIERDVMNDMAYNLVETIRTLDNNWSEAKVELSRVDAERQKAVDAKIEAKSMFEGLKEKFTEKTKELNDALENLDNARRQVESLEDQVQIQKDIEDKTLVEINQKHNLEMMELKAKLYDLQEKMKNKDKMIHDLTDRICRMNEDEDDDQDELGETEEEYLARMNKAGA